MPIAAAVQAAKSTRCPSTAAEGTIRVRSIAVSAWRDASAAFWPRWDEKPPPGVKTASVVRHPRVDDGGTPERGDEHGGRALQSHREVAAQHGQHDGHEPCRW